MLEPPSSYPARSYAQALQRAHALMHRDDERIAPFAKTALLDHNERRSWCVVLLHGLTNNPTQYRQFAPLVFAQGANVLVPRMPKHGFADRMTSALATVTAEDFLTITNEAIDIACGLGERVAIMGISAGALLAAYFGQHRPDLTHAVPVAPDFALLRFPRTVTVTLEKLCLALPNTFMWWDPRIKAAQQPETAYPRFPTHALMQTLRIGDDVYNASRTTAPKAQRITTIVNTNDPAVNNAVTRTISNAWTRQRKQGIEYIEVTGLPKNHDIIDPSNPLASIDVVYPRLLQALDLTTPA